MKRKELGKLQQVSTQETTNAALKLSDNQQLLVTFAVKVQSLTTLGKPTMSHLLTQTRSYFQHTAHATLREATSRLRDALKKLLG
jgi:spore coat protein CotF